MSKKIMRPSAHDQAVLCVGSVQAQAPYGWTTNESAERGKRLHDAVALILQTGEKGIIAAKSNELILDDDFAHVEECVKHAGELMPDDADVITLIEHKLDLTWLGLTGGKPDLAYISPQYKAAVIIDWKFGAGGVPDPEDNRQMLDYAIGIKALALKKYGVELESVEAYIIQPSSWREDDRLRGHTWAGAELDQMISTVQEEALAVQRKGAPRTAGDFQCKWCKHKEKCPEYQELKSVQDEARATAKASEIASVVRGSGIMVVADEPLEAPVNLISQETVDKAQERLALAKTMTVVDDATANTAGTLSKDIRKLVSLIEERRKDIKAPFWKFGQKIDAEARKATDPLNEAIKVLDGQQSAFFKARADAEAKKRAEEERRRLEAEKAAQKALEAQKQAEREAEEALRRAAEEQERAERLKTKKAREAAEAKAAEEYAKATAASKAAQEEAEKQAQAERDARLSDALSIKQAPAKIVGYKAKEQVTWEIEDYSKIPKAFLQMVLEPNVKAVDLLIKQGKISEEKCAKWITIKRETIAAKTR